jgi:MarR family transcriptional regulator, organic hydroperoxide resistance regulator
MPDASAGYEQLELDRQLCFPLYATSRLLTRLYQDQLTPLGLTYPQYVVLMILWQDAPCSVGSVGQRAMLNSNTLTPLLKRLEQQGLIERLRDGRDERRVSITLTAAGWQLREQCRGIPEAMLASVEAPVEKLQQLKALLDELMPVLRKQAGGE